MAGNEIGLTRRDFLLRSSRLGLLWAGGAGGLLSADAAAGAEVRRSNRSTVVLIRDRDVLEAGTPDPDRLARMLDRGVAALLQESDPASAWRRLVAPSDVVGIKSNVWRFLPTPAALENAILDRVRAVGVPPERIAVDDRGVLENPVFQRANTLINVRPLRTHHWAGVGSCLKNYIMFSPDPPSWHDDSCARLGGLWHLPMVRDKTRLNVLVMLTPLFHGKGPHHFQARYTWEYKGLLLGTDPVAVDSVGVRILAAKRREHFGVDQPFTVSPKHIRVAAERYGLGIADSARIDVRKIGWMEDALL